jgi:hypothetical protein
MEDDIPIVHFTVKGGMPFYKSEGDVKVLMRYISKTATIERHCTAKVQGDSSGSRDDYKKRNWTIKIYKDNSYEDKEKLTFKNWPAMSSFVLKAGWTMPGHLRNVGAAKVWGQIMRTRQDYNTLPEELRNSPNQGATDGFHVRVFINGMYWGIYDWIVKKDKLFGQDSENPAHSILNSEYNNQLSCAFATTEPVIDGNWSEELLDEMTPETKTSMENWIKFVAGASDAEFVANAENYFDVQSAIDVNIFDRILCVVDSLCKNQIVYKYDAKWFLGKWDLDAILGLPPLSGGSWYAYDTKYQAGYAAYPMIHTNNKLFERVETLFASRFKARYLELRKGPLSEANLVEVFGRLSDRLRSIEGLLAEENASTTGNGEFTAMPNVAEDTIYQIRDFVVKRCAYMDEEIENMTAGVSVPCTGISLSADTLTFTAQEAQTLIATVAPVGCTEPVVWESSNNEVATVSGGVVTAIDNGTATITARCGEYSDTCAVTVSGIAEQVYHTVTNNLTNCTNSNTASKVAAGASYSATITANTGYVVEELSVTHNGDAVATDNGAFTIGVVAGDITITATAFLAPKELKYTLSEPTVFDGTNYIDTEVALLDEDRDFTIAADFIPAETNPTYAALYRFGENRCGIDGGMWRVFCGPGYDYAVTLASIADAVSHGGVKFVLTHAADSGKATIHAIFNDGTEINAGQSVEVTMDKFVTTQTVYLGTNQGISYNNFFGTVNAFSVEDRIWSDEEIMSFIDGN